MEVFSWDWLRYFFEKILVNDGNLIMLPKPSMLSFPQTAVNVTKVLMPKENLEMLFAKNKRKVYFRGRLRSQSVSNQLLIEQMMCALMIV